MKGIGQEFLVIGLEIQELMYSVESEKLWNSISSIKNLNEKEVVGFKDEVGVGLGQKVVHPTFGLGVVLNYEGSGESARVQINFEKAGSKWLVLAFAKLEMLG